jgi:hypothetical protein
MEDAVQYLDMARAASHGQFEWLINTLWSPAYPALLAVALSVSKPSMQLECAMMRVVNLLIFATTMLAFEFFLREVTAHFRRLHSAEDVPSCLSEGTFRTALYLVFVATTLTMAGVYQDTPDMLINAFFYVATALLLKLAGGQTNWRNYFCLGLVLGLGYYVKAIFFPLVFIFTVLCWYLTQKAADSLKKTILLLTVALLVCSPWVYCMSEKMHHFSFGDATRLAYFEAVSGAYKTEHAENLELIHKDEVLSRKPTVYLFELDEPCTYAPFFNRSYWREGAVLRFSPLFSIIVCSLNLIAFVGQFGGVFILSILALWALEKQFPFTTTALKKILPLIVPPVVAISLYMTITNLFFPYVSRYYSCYATVLTAGLFCAISLGKASKKNQIMALITVCLPLALTIVMQFVSDLAIETYASDQRDWQIAQSLQSLGVEPGDRVAQMGFEYGIQEFKRGPTQFSECKSYYWAHLAGVKIVADIPNDDQFFKASQEKQKEIKDQLKSKNVKAIILYPGLKPPPEQISTWRKLADGKSYACLL